MSEVLCFNGETSINGETLLISTYDEFHYQALLTLLFSSFSCVADSIKSSTNHNLKT